MINLRNCLIAAITLAFSFPVFAQTPDDLLLITEEYAPLNFEKDGKLQGIAVDAMVEMLKLSGAKKKREDIQIWPWARGYETVLKDKNTVLFAMTRTEARENLFKWVGPIMPSRIVLLAKKKRHIKLNSIDDINRSDYNIGVVREDIGEQMLLQLGANKKKLNQTNSGISAAKMLHADRIDLWAYGDSVALWNFKQLGYPTGEYEQVYTLKESQQYYALNKQTDDKIVAQLQAALDSLKASGKLGEVIKKYQ